jgi:hypothetical protein
MMSFFQELLPIGQTVIPATRMRDRSVLEKILKDAERKLAVIYTFDSPQKVEILIDMYKKGQAIAWNPVIIRSFTPQSMTMFKLENITREDVIQRIVSDADRKIVMVLEYESKEKRDMVHELYKSIASFIAGV